MDIPRILLFFTFPFSCVLGQEIAVLNNEKVSISCLNQLNTNFRECNLSIMPNGKELYFMSTRRKPFNKSFGDGDIYKSTYVDSTWTNPEYIDQINTNNGEDEPSVSYDGENIYFQSWRNSWESSGGPYYVAEIDNGKLKNVKGLGGGINQFFRKQYRSNLGYATDGMAISPDGNLFIVACGPSYKGKMDLYFSIKKHGVWTFPKLLNASTIGDERSVYIAADNKTIYFSSDGYDGFGKLDIYKTTWNGVNAEEPMNIGKPFNTRKDDMGFVISGRGEAAYFIRDLDIYYADLRGKKKSLKPDPSVLVYGKIMFNDTPVQKPVRIVSEGLILGTTYSDEYGRYSINVPSGFSIADVFVEGAEEQYQHYKITSKSKRYEEFKVDFFAFQKSQDEKDTTIEVPSSELEQHLSTMIYFEFDEFDLSFDELIKLKNLIQSINQSSVIYIVGHTDHTGTERYNLDLSRKRAIAVQDFIIEFTGLNKNQIILRFEGERNTLNKGDTLEERSLNRRVSVKIMNH